MKTALITGASSGIGLEMAKYHASLGGDLVIVARSEQKLEELKAKLEKEYGIAVAVIAMDLTGEHSAKELMDEIYERDINVDYLINNAGIGECGAFADVELGLLQQLIQLNITTLTNLTHYFVKEKLAKKQEAKILNVASTAAFQGVPYMGVYAASKAYVLSFTEALAVELKDKGITVTALCPGPTKSNFGNAANLDSKLANFPLLPSARTMSLS